MVINKYFVDYRLDNYYKPSYKGNEFLKKGFEKTPSTATRKKNRNKRNKK